MADIAPADAARELLRRRRARASLVGFSQAIEIPGRPVSDDEDEWLFRPVETGVAAHHRLIMETIERAVATPNGRTMLFLPPGSAKSTYASVVAIPYFMGCRAGFRAILASYASDLARKLGRRARQIVRSPAYRAVCSAALSPDSAAADEWSLTNGSEYMAGGILSGITGNRADLVVIDDPIKGRAEADSDVIRRRTREAYEDDLRTRLLPGGSIVIIQTRWHEDDLAGSILPERYDGRSGPVLCRDGRTWDVLSIPAKCERTDDPLGRRIGEYLWPEWFGADHWLEAERTPRTWAALYQQRPTSEEGDYFRREWIELVDELPPLAEMSVYGGSDYAVTADGGDYTAHVVVGIDPLGNPYVLDVWRRQASSDVWVEAWCDLVLRWRPFEWAEESGQIRAAVGPYLETRSRERRAYTVRRQIPTKGDKPARAQSIRGLVASRKLRVPRHAPWAADLVSEMLRFPAGAHDDQVDALGLVGQLLAEVISGQALVPEDDPRRPPPDMRLIEDDSSWRL